MKNKSAQLLGKKGGSVKSTAKANSARKNGATQKGIKIPFIIEVSFFLAGPPITPKYLSKSLNFLETKRGAWRFESKEDAQREVDYLNSEERDIETRDYKVIDTRVKS